MLTFQPLLDEIHHYTGWLYLLNISAFFLDADALYDIVIKTEKAHEEQKSAYVL